jgi:formylmethanofuran dehydrogenase subunit E
MREPWELLADAEAAEARRLARLPKCDICGEHINQDRAVHFREFWICDDCLESIREELEEEGWTE